jgi:hypothetical protein
MLNGGQLPHPLMAMGLPLLVLALHMLVEEQ